MKTMYKLITRGRKTREGCPNETYWPIGEWREATGTGGLCSDGMLHCYSDPCLALFLNCIHADINNPIVCEVETAGESRRDGQLKSGYKRMRVIRDLDIPEPTMEQRIMFAIWCGLLSYGSYDFTTWAEGWLNNRDRSAQAATRAARAAAWAATPINIVSLADIAHYVMGIE